MPEPMDLSQFEGNPFEATLAQLGQQPQGQPQPQQPPQQPQAAPGMTGEMEPEEDQLNPGENPDNTQNLIAALRALENYIKSSTDREEIMTARGIITLLTRLVAKDQASMSAKI